MNRPITVLLTPYILGVLFVYYCEINPLTMIILLLISIITLFYNIINNSLNQKFLIVLFFFLGIFTTVTVNNGSALIHQVDKRSNLYGTVEQVIHIDDTRGKYVVKVGQLDNKSITKEKIILNVIGNMDLERGDTICFNGVLKIPPENSNPKLFNYRLALMSDKIYTTMTIKDYSIREINKNNPNIRYTIKSKIISHIEDLFSSKLKEDNSSLITSIILGKSNYLNEENLFLYRDMGLAHILAVSGLHIGIISGFLIFLFSRLGIKRSLNLSLTLGLIWIYGYLIDFPPSILRSSIMFTVLFCSQLIHEPYDSINTLSLAALVLLLINPYYLFNLGFQLSFMATISIILFAPKLNSIFYPNNNRLTNTLSSLIGVQIGLFPIQIYYFNKISLLSIPANIVVVPLLSLSLILGLLMIIFSYVIPFLNVGIGIVLDFILSLQFKILDMLNHIPYNIYKIFSPEIISILLFYIIILFLFGFIDIKRLNKDIHKIMLVCLFLIIVFNMVFIINDKSVELHFIDVGQGDAIFIRTRKANYLMDTGGSFFDSMDIGNSITLPYLEKLGVKRLDGIFITHFDEDHSQGLNALMENLKIDYIISSYYPEDSQLTEKIKTNKIPFMILKKGHRLFLDKEVNLDILWPCDELDNSYKPNNRSLVSLLTIEDTKILLTGDIEKEGEILIAKDFNEKVDIIKIPHHGSNTSSTWEFIEELKPEVGIISVGRNNFYGHPNIEVLERYKELRTQIYRTDSMGLIEIKHKNGDYFIKHFLQNGVRPKFNIPNFIYEHLILLLFYIVYFVVLCRYITWLFNRYTEENYIYDYGARDHHFEFKSIDPNFRI